MTLGTKLVLIFAALGLAPLLALSAVSYRSGVGAVEELLRERASERAARVGRKVTRTLAEEYARLDELSRDASLVSYLRDARAQTPASAAVQQGAPGDVRARFDAFFRNDRDLQSLTCINPSGVPLFRLSLKGQEVYFQTDAFTSADARHDPQVWKGRGQSPLHSPPANEGNGTVLRVTVPAGPPDEATPYAALVAEVKLGDVVREADEAVAAGDPSAAGGAGRERRSLVAIDNATDDVVYHTNSAYGHRNASEAMPYFAAVAKRMKSGAEGSDFYDEQDGGRRLAAFRQVEGTGVSLAASEDYSAAAGPVRRAGLLGACAALVAGLAGVGLLVFIARRETHGIEEVARGASAIAAGQLDQRINVSRSGETRELAECFNAMSDKLREHIAREAELRQFQSFLRISAMISHDLKNAIAGLSLLVTNMEKQFHREEFRADAIESLREATEKLKRTVARLSEPAKSLSGEYRIASRPTDLVTVIRRVLATNAEPMRSLYDIDVRLPDTLVATVEPERVENVVENLVINAFEAMASKGGGRLTVEAGSLPDGLVFFSVADTGVGMSEEFIKTRLFRPFSTTKTKGIGLGLFTCREIVETHGGRLEVDSSPNAGTRFRVVLPSSLFKSGERRGRPEKVTAAAGKTGRVAPE